METSTKVLLLFIMYGLPLCIAIIYRITKNRKLKQKAIQENDVLDIIGNELPEINNELKKASATENIYKTVHYFAKYTKKECLSKTNNGK